MKLFSKTHRVVPATVVLVLSTTQFTLVAMGAPAAPSAKSAPTKPTTPNKSAPSDTWLPLTDLVPPLPKIKTEIVDPLGHVMPTDLVVVATWGTSDGRGKFPDGFPVLRISVEIPPSLDLDDEKLKQQSYKLEDGKITFEVTSMVTTFTLPIHQVRQGKNEVGIVIRVSPTKAQTFWVHASCTEQGIRFRQLPSKTQFFFAAAYCSEKKDSTLVQIYVSDGAGIRAPLIARYPLKEIQPKPPYIYQYEIKRGPDMGTPLDPGYQKIADLTITTGPDDTNEKAGTHIEVSAKSQAVSKRFGWGASLSFTGLSYSQNPGGLSIFSFNNTLKAYASYELIPNKMIVALSAFGTVLPWVTVPNNPSPWFVGINGRAGYMIPGTFLKSRWAVFLGWYEWTMIVANNAYGISSLGGPQLLFTATGATSTSKRFSGYFKYAPLFESSGGFAIGNNELAIGGTYQISPNTWDKRLDLILDLSYLNFKSQVSTNQASLGTYSLGIQLAF